MAVIRKQSEPLLQKHNELTRHLIQLVQKAIGIDVAESRADRIIHKEQIRKFVPRAIVHREFSSFPHPIRPNLHERTILRTAARSAIEPDDEARSVRQMSVLVEPEEEVSAVFGRDFDMPTHAIHC
jgi:hypothetical protein